MVGATTCIGVMFRQRSFLCDMHRHGYEPDDSWPPRVARPKRAESVRGVCGRRASEAARDVLLVHVGSV